MLLGYALINKTTRRPLEISVGQSSRNCNCGSCPQELSYELCSDDCDNAIWIADTRDGAEYILKQMREKHYTNSGATWFSPSICSSLNADDYEIIPIGVLTE